MEDLSRSEYPALLAVLQPGQAVLALQDRVRRINKINQEIAEWLQERRKVEEQYVAGLRKLLLFKVPNSASELGVFQGPWDKILLSAQAIADAHHVLASRIEKDVELPLRNFHNKKEMQNMGTISGNLQIMAKELEEAQEKADKLTRKGGKANAHKVDAAITKLESAQQQWESQAPFVFESLQALDEQRINHLRDVLTQLETHEVDQATRTQSTAEEALNLMLEINTAHEIQSFAQRMSVGRPKLERRTNTRQSSFATGSAVTPPVPPMPPLPTGTPGPHEDDTSDHSAPTESRLRSRIGTMLGRRRQSIHGGFGPLSPAKGSGPFGRGLGSSHSRTISPRASSHNLADSSHRLSSLAERPDSPHPPGTAETNNAKPSHEGTNGVGGDGSAESGQPSRTLVNGGLTAEDIFDVPAPPGPPPSHLKAAEMPEAAKDADGFTVPVAKNDPISQAQREAAEEGGAAGTEDNEQLFKLNIQSEPMAEEDAEAKQAAMSNVVNTLSMAMPSRKSGTVRGRRDVRNTIYVPPLPSHEGSSGSPIVPIPSPALPGSTSRPSAVAALASESSIAGTSDTQSVRSATSLGSLAHVKHPDMSNPGLNASIIETVSATFEAGELKAVKLAGEIAFAYNPTDSAPFKESEVIRINNFPALEAIGPNRIFVQNMPAPDEFTLDLAHLQRTAVGFTYRAHADDATSLAEHCPLAIKPAWKPTGDKLGLLLQYRLNPDARLPRPVTLHNLVFVATYEGARASGAQTKPSGTHLKDKHIVYWRLGDVTLSDDWVKIVCRIIGDQGAEPQPGHIEARWEYTQPAALPPAGEEEGGSAAAEAVAGTGISVSRLQEGKGKEKAADLDDPFADEGAASPHMATAAEGGAWVEVPTVKKIVSGHYEAK